MKQLPLVLTLRNLEKNKLFNRVLRAEAIFDPSSYFSRLEELEEEVIKYYQLERLQGDPSPQNTVVKSDLLDPAEELIEVMGRIIDGFYYLKKSGFSGQEFSILVPSCDNPHVMEVVPLSEENQVQIISIEPFLFYSNLSPL